MTAIAVVERRDHRRDVAARAVRLDLGGPRATPTQPSMVQYRCTWPRSATGGGRVAAAHQHGRARGQQHRLRRAAAAARPSGWQLEALVPAAGLVGDLGLHHPRLQGVRRPGPPRLAPGRDRPVERLTGAARDRRGRAAGCRAGSSAAHLPMASPSRARLLDHRPRGCARPPPGRRTAASMPASVVVASATTPGTSRRWPALSASTAHAGRLVVPAPVDQRPGVQRQQPRPQRGGLVGHQRRAPRCVAGSGSCGPSSISGASASAISSRARSAAGVSSPAAGPAGPPPAATRPVRVAGGDQRVRRRGVVSATGSTSSAARRRRPQLQRGLVVLGGLVGAADRHRLVAGPDARADRGGPVVRGPARAAPARRPCPRRGRRQRLAYAACSRTRSPGSRSS